MWRWLLGPTHIQPLKKYFENWIFLLQIFQSKVHHWILITLCFWISQFSRKSTELWVSIDELLIERFSIKISNTWQFFFKSPIRAGPNYLHLHVQLVTYDFDFLSHRLPINVYMKKELYTLQTATKLEILPPTAFFPGSLSVHAENSWLSHSKRGKNVASC